MEKQSGAEVTPTGESLGHSGGTAGSPIPPDSVISTQSPHLTLRRGTGQEAGRCGAGGRTQAYKEGRPLGSGVEAWGVVSALRSVFWTDRRTGGQRRRQPGLTACTGSASPPEARASP